MKKEIRELINYMKEQRQKLEELKMDCEKSAETKKKLDDKKSGFYKDAELEHSNNLKKYNDLANETKEEIQKRKSEIIARLEADKKAIDKFRKEYKSEYVDESLMHKNIIDKREALERAKAFLKYLKQTLPATNESNKDRIAYQEERVATLEEEFNESIRIVNLIPEGKSPIDIYLELQEKVKNVEQLNLGNVDELMPNLIEEETEIEEKGSTGEGAGKPVEGKEPAGEGAGKPVEGKKPAGKGASKPVEGKKPAGKGASKPVEGKEPAGKGAGKPVEGKEPVKPDSVDIEIDVSTGLATLNRTISGKSHSVSVDIETIFNRKKEKEVRNAVLELLEENESYEHSKKIKNIFLRRKFNPAVLELLRREGKDGVKLIQQYIDAVKEGDKDKLPFSKYDIKLNNGIHISEEAFARVNRSALEDNKNLGTEFNATPWYTFKKFLNKFSKKLPFVKKWIGALPEPAKEYEEYKKKYTEKGDAILEEVLVKDNVGRTDFSKRMGVDTTKFKPIEEIRYTGEAKEVIQRSEEAKKVILGKEISDDGEPSIVEDDDLTL